MKTLIVGGGLTGLSIARQLSQLHHQFVLLEARDRFGGRILTESVENAVFDMGPAWFWPGQPRIAKLVDRLGLNKFEQYSRGDLVFEDEAGRIHRGQGFASMEGSLRIVGGFAALIAALEKQVPQSSKRLEAETVSVECKADRCVVALADGSEVRGDQVVIARPPRVAAGISYSPYLPDEGAALLAATPTWMGGQAKVVAIYDTPFWREAGLSGDAMSRKGPLIEIHDASPASGGPYALFGFVGLPTHARSDQEVLRRSAVAQLTRIFGASAATPRAVYMKDWALDPLTSTACDHRPLQGHPVYERPAALRGMWDGRLIFAGTELAAHFGGYIEGALESAEAAISELASNTSRHARAAI